MRGLYFFFLLWFTGSVLAQSATTALPSATPVFQVSSNFVILDAVVENKKTGGLIGTLQGKDFQLSEDGVPQTITYFSHNELPLSIVFLFDLTDSVRPVLKPLAAGAREVLDHLKPQDEVAIMTFSSSTQLLQDFTTDRSLAVAAIGKAAAMKSNQGTFIHEDMYEAVGEAMRSTVPGSRRVLVWLTDGTSNVENKMSRKIMGRDAPLLLHTRQEATEKLIHSGVVVSALIEKMPGLDALVLADDAGPLAPLVGAKLGDVRRYADETGGPVLNTSKKQVAIRLADLIDQVRGRYTLGYKPSTPKPAGTFCNVHLELDPAGYKQIPNVPKKNIVIRTERGYYR